MKNVAHESAHRRLRAGEYIDDEGRIRRPPRRVRGKDMPPVEAQTDDEAASRARDSGVAIRTPCEWMQRLPGEGLIPWRERLKLLMNRALREGQHVWAHYSHIEPRWEALKRELRETRKLEKLKKKAYQQEQAAMVFAQKDKVRALGKRLILWRKSQDDYVQVSIALRRKAKRMERMGKRERAKHVVPQY